MIFLRFVVMVGVAFIFPLSPNASALEKGQTVALNTNATTNLGAHTLQLPKGTRVLLLNVRGDVATISVAQADKSQVIVQVPAAQLSSVTGSAPASSSAPNSQAEPSSAKSEIFVSPTGNDQANGTLTQPLATLGQAQQLARQSRGLGRPVTVNLRAGTYYLPGPLIFTSLDSGSPDAPVIYQAYQGEKPILSGGVKLSNLNWQPYKDGIMQTAVPAGLQTDQLFINGERQIMARYPNYDPNVLIFNGHSSDAISQSRVDKWSNPAGGFFHVMHAALWGDFSYLITGKTADGKLKLSGGWQNNRPSTKDHDFVGDVPGVHADDRFVENIFEELDAPGEWFLNSDTHVLYYYPLPGEDLKQATVEAVKLKDLVEFQGSQSNPVKYVFLQGLTFRQTSRTFMDTREPIVRTDWALYRGGTIFVNGSENCGVQDSFLDQLGGNAIFVNNYNRRFTVKGCHIFKAGANGVVFLGDPAAARSPLLNYDLRQDYRDIDKASGPQTDNYPADCLVDDCLIHQTGQFEKQTAPIAIDLAQSITVRHCSIYDVPRAGINIGDGCWGGHIIEYCDVFDTVKETGDHGSFNSWGRDRWWELTGVNLNKAIDGDDADLPRLDAVKPIILRNNRWRCDHGWDIDLDDGSSNYEIMNNLCLAGGIKNREGFYRVVENNITVNNTYFPQVWFTDSQDVVTHNLLWTTYNPAIMGPKPWGKEMDNNLIVKIGATGTEPAHDLQNASGRDENSIVADPLFIDAAHGDYRVKSDSPALKLGFVNFPMDQFGVQKPELAALARTPQLPGGGAAPRQIEREDATATWNGIQVRNVRDEGEMSAYGLPGVTGVLVLKIDPASDLAKAGLQVSDVILAINGNAVAQVADLTSAPLPAKSQIHISRNQTAVVISL